MPVTPHRPSRRAILRGRAAVGPCATVLGMGAWARRRRPVLVFVLVGVAVAAILVCVWALVAAPRGAVFPWSLPPGRTMVVTLEQYRQIVRLTRLVEVAAVVAVGSLVAAIVLAVLGRRGSDRRSQQGR